MSIYMNVYIYRYIICNVAHVAHCVAKNTIDAFPSEVAQGCIHVCDLAAVARCVYVCMYVCM